MARIRTIKPEFFRHEGLQDLEVANPGACCMLVFAGLWGHCDKAGTFEWKPRTLKLDILPFLPFDMEQTLQLLLEAGHIEQFSADGKIYGRVPSFAEHQRIGGKESEAPTKYPEAPVKQRGSTGEAPVKRTGLQEGKGREKEREQEGNGDARASPDVDWLEVRQNYPPGTYPDAKWMLAEREFYRLTESYAPAEVLAGVRGYRAQQDAEGNTGTRFVKSPEKFFHDGHWRGPFPLSRAPPKVSAVEAARAKLRGQGDESGNSDLGPAAGDIRRLTAT